MARGSDPRARNRSITSGSLRIFASAWDRASMIGGGVLGRGQKAGEGGGLEVLEPDLAEGGHIRKLRHAGFEVTASAPRVRPSFNRAARDGDLIEIELGVAAITSVVAGALPL